MPVQPSSVLHTPPSPSPSRKVFAGLFLLKSETKRVQFSTEFWVRGAGAVWPPSPTGLRPHGVIRSGSGAARLADKEPRWRSEWRRGVSRTRATAVLSPRPPFLPLDPTQPHVTVQALLMPPSGLARVQILVFVCWVP